MCGLGLLGAVAVSQRQRHHHHIISLARACVLCGGGWWGAVAQQLRRPRKRIILWCRKWQPSRSRRSSSRSAYLLQSAISKYIHGSPQCFSFLYHTRHTREQQSATIRQYTTTTHLAIARVCQRDSNYSSPTKIPKTLSPSRSLCVPCGVCSAHVAEDDVPAARMNNANNTAQQQTQQRRTTTPSLVR